MITIDILKVDTLIEFVNETDIKFDNHTFGCDVVNKFIECMEWDSDSECKRINQYKIAINEVFNSALDSHNEELDYTISRIYEHVTNCTNVLLTPVDLVIHKILNRQNYFLSFKQKFKQQILNNNISIDEIDISDCLFILNNLSLISDELVEMYVSLESIDTLLSAKHLMGNCGNASESNTDIVEDSKVNNNVNSITFSDEYETVVKFNDFINNSELISVSFHKLLVIGKNDYNRLLSENGVHEYFIKGFVQPLLNMYKAITSEVVYTQTRVIDNLTILINLTKNIHKKYHHKLTRYILSWLVLLLKYELDEAASDSSQRTLNSNKLRYSKLVVGLADDKVSGCDDVLTMVKVCEELQVVIRKTFNIVQISNMSNIEGVSTESTSEGSDENYSVGVSNRIGQSSSQMIKALNESFEVLKNGEIKIVLKSKTTYMDEYAINHRLLKYNCDQNDIEGMKYNLVYALLIVESTEKNVLYNKKVNKNSELYKDAEKARSFALNDIKTYSDIVRKADRNFDLNAFYKKVKADELSITIDAPSTISGIKKIVSAITS